MLLASANDARDMCRGSLPSLARVPHRARRARHAAIKPCSPQAHKQGSAGATHVLQDGDEKSADEREEAAAVPAGSGEGRRSDPSRESSVQHARSCPQEPAPSHTCTCSEYRACAHARAWNLALTKIATKSKKTETTDSNTNSRWAEDLSNHYWTRDTRNKDPAAFEVCC